MRHTEERYISLLTDFGFKRITKTELREYEDSLKAYRDIKNSLDTAEEKGRAEGLAEGRAEVAKKLLAMGMSPSDISKATGLTLDEISMF